MNGSDFNVVVENISQIATAYQFSLEDDASQLPRHLFFFKDLLQSGIELKKVISSIEDIEADVGLIAEN